MEIVAVLRHRHRSKLICSPLLKPSPPDRRSPTRIKIQGRFMYGIGFRIEVSLSFHLKKHAVVVAPRKKENQLSSCCTDFPCKSRRSTACPIVYEEK